jgi:hypothetical protein
VQQFENIKDDVIEMSLDQIYQGLYFVQLEIDGKKILHKVTIEK